MVDKQEKTIGCQSLSQFILYWFLPVAVEKFFVYVDEAINLVFGFTQAIEKSTKVVQCPH